MRAVRFDRYGAEDVLDVREVQDPEPAPGHVIVRVRAAAINPGEILIRNGGLHARWPSRFPSGQGSDFAGTVVEVDPNLERPAVGDEVLGWTDERSSHAELVSVPATHLIPRPAGMPLDVAGSMFVAPMAGYAGFITTQPTAGETVVVSAATSSTGFIAAQLARNAGATVIGLASPTNHAWLEQHGIRPVTYGPGQADRIRDIAPGRIDALIDCHTGGYLDLGTELAVRPHRMNTLIDFTAAARIGAHAVGASQVVTAAVLAEVADLVTQGALEIPIAATYPMNEVRAAYRQLSSGHVRGKIVLHP